MNFVFVTGGAGFIGHNVCKRLLDEGYDIVSLDNFNDYYDVSLKEENFDSVLNLAKKLNRQAIMYRDDVRNKAIIEEIIKTYKPIAVIHLAQNAGVRPSIEKPLHYIDVNINGMVNILEVMKEYDLKKMVFISSSSIYGNNKKIPFKETDFVDNPISPYAATKKSCELFASTYHSLYKFDIHCLRYFTVYGPCQRPDLAINKFTRLMIQDKEIEMYGDGSSARDYTYVDDIVEGTILSFKYLLKNSDVFDVFNLGGSNPIKLKELIDIIALTLNKKPKIKVLPMQKGDVDITYSDYSHAQEVLGYNPKVKIEEGIKNFVNWYKKKYEKN